MYISSILKFFKFYIYDDNIAFNCKIKKILCFLKDFR